MIYRILVTGSRSWKDTEKVHGMLDAVASGALQSGFTGVVVVHGGAKGADTSAHLWAAEQRRRGEPVQPEPHPVTGAQWRARGVRAGGERNQRMVESGVDVCLAFVNPCESEKCRKPRPHGTHGAEDCIERCEAEGVEVFRTPPRAGA